MKKANEPFLLAHHPSCEFFEHHTIIVRGRRLCMGCFVMYPAAAVSLAILFMLNMHFTLEHFTLLAAALILFGINLVRKIAFKDNFRKAVHIIFRAELGVTLALVIMAAYIAEGRERIAIVLLGLAVAVIYNIYNGKRNLNVCRRCPQHPGFPRCDGLKENYPAAVINKRDNLSDRIEGDLKQE